MQGPLDGPWSGEELQDVVHSILRVEARRFLRRGPICGMVSSAILGSERIGRKVVIMGDKGKGKDAGKAKKAKASKKPDNRPHQKRAREAEVKKLTK